MSELVIQADLGGLQIAFTAPLPEDEATLNQTIDLYSKAIGRQKAKIALADTLAKLAADRLYLQSFDRELQDYRIGRAKEMAEVRARQQATHNPNKRAEYKPSERDRQELAAYETQTQAEVDNRYKRRDSTQQTIKVYEKQIEKLRRMINGEEIADAIEAAADADMAALVEAERLPEAAD